MSEEKKHAKFGPSAAERWINCPASIQLSAKAPKPRESDVAAEGTKAHSALEHLLKNQKNPLAASEFARRTYGLQMTVHAEAAVKEILKRKPKGADLLSEAKADLSFIDPDFYGTADATIVEYFGKLTVVDYKYGQGVIVEPNTAQLIAYALGMAHAFDFNFDTIELIIIQPRAEHKDGPVRSHVMTIDELLSWRKKFADAIKACKDPKAKTCAGKWCRFCPAAAICPELSTKAMKEAAIVFDDAAGTVNLPAVADEASRKVIDLAKLGKTLTALDLIDDWGKAVRKQATDLLNDGLKIPGWKMVEGRGRREWVDEAKTAKEAQKKFGPLAFVTPDLLSVPQLEKVAGKEWVSARSIMKSSGLTMVPESDPRPATSRIEKVFETKEGQGNNAAAISNKGKRG